MKQLRYTGRDPFYLLDFPRLSEPYLFKRSSGHICDIQDKDYNYLMVAYRGILAEVPEEVIVDAVFEKPESPVDPCPVPEPPAEEMEAEPPTPEPTPEPEPAKPRKPRPKRTPANKIYKRKSKVKDGDKRI